MKVLHLTAQPRSGSGIADFSAAWRTALAASGVEVTPLWVDPDPCFSRAEIHRYAAAAVQAAARGCDAVHAELGGGTLHEFYGALAIVAARQVPVCLTLHDPPRPVWTPHEYGAVRDRRSRRVAMRALRRRQSLALESMLLQRAEAVFVLSQRGGAAICQRFPVIDSAKVRVLPYPARFCRPSRREASPRADDSDLVIGFYGYWYGGKGIEALIDAVAQLACESPRVRLKLWGEPPSNGGDRPGATYRRRVLRAIARSGAADRIEVLGKLPEHRVADELATCDAVVLPYTQPRSRDGLASASGVLFDALGVGVPVIAADVRALAEFVDDGVNGIVFSPEEPLALASALRRLRDNQLLRVRLREGALRAAGGLAPGLAGAHTLDIYRRLIAPPIGVPTPLAGAGAVDNHSAKRSGHTP